MRKLLTLVLALSLVLSITACGNGNDNNHSADNNPSADNNLPGGSETPSTEGTALTLEEEVQQSIKTETGATDIDGVTLPVNNIVLSSSMHGELGFDYKQEITADQLSTAGLNAKNVKLFYISDKNFTEVKDAVTANADGGITVTINHFSWYVLGDEPPVLIVEVDFSDKGITDRQLAEMVESGEIPANVTHLKLQNNKISHIAPLSVLSDLRQLSIWGNEVNSLTALSGLTNLHAFWAGGNQISDLTPLAGLTNLRWLHLPWNQITDVTPLAGMTKLLELHLDNNKIKDISALYGMMNLEVDKESGLKLADNFVSQEEINKLIAHIKGNSIPDTSPPEEEGGELPDGIQPGEYITINRAVYLPTYSIIVDLNGITEEMYNHRMEIATYRAGTEIKLESKELPTEFPQYHFGLDYSYEDGDYEVRLYVNNAIAQRIAFTFDSNYSLAEERRNMVFQTDGFSDDQLEYFSLHTYKGGLDANGNRSGYGELYMQGITLLYAGYWENGVPNGEGTMYGAGGGFGFHEDYLKGTFVNGFAHGDVTLYVNRGDDATFSFTLDMGTGKDEEVANNEGITETENRFLTPINPGMQLWGVRPFIGGVNPSSEIFKVVN